MMPLTFHRREEGISLICIYVSAHSTERWWVRLVRLSDYSFAHFASNFLSIVSQHFRLRAKASLSPLGLQFISALCREAEDNLLGMSAVTSFHPLHCATELPWRQNFCLRTNWRDKVSLWMKIENLHSAQNRNTLSCLIEVRYRLLGSELCCKLKMKFHSLNYSRLRLIKLTSTSHPSSQLDSDSSRRSPTW